MLPAAYGVGTALPVIAFAFILAFASQAVAARHPELTNHLFHVAVIMALGAMEGAARMSGVPRAGSAGSGQANRRK